MKKEGGRKKRELTKRMVKMEMMKKGVGGDGEKARHSTHEEEKEIRIGR